jgi:hypothetical protein
MQCKNLMRWKTNTCKSLMHVQETHAVKRTQCDVEDPHARRDSCAMQKDVWKASCDVGLNTRCREGLNAMWRLCLHACGALNARRICDARAQPR